eukprot:CAMPEP_0183321582 /NCGR_PEP_ID=MMETSP0160_2-20130417/69232_1 /TAXON_ID=2839 ORGANISM="Odontella Sinensis, Strain Grunow 1884" /NCGR_SAMPLE_ID=MMETSP0160_2 /ASSEMBLY_ACC=CAM_ASM_000250 /LENGTH=121 /DNA_ID=CAMNT_0025488549 /DNA_START=1 /DNA_END=366 /DNA_ORIENTATION=+
MLYKIEKEKLLKILKDFPETEATMMRVARSRKRRLDHYVSPSSCPLLPEDEIDSEDSKTELFGVDAAQVASAKEEEFERKQMGHRSRHSQRVSSLIQQQKGEFKRRCAHQGGRVVPRPQTR